MSLPAAGLRVGLYDYLMMWPPLSFPNGFVIPGWLRRDASVTPPDVWSRICLAPYVNSYDGARTSRDYLQRAHSEIRNKGARWKALRAAFDLAGQPVPGDLEGRIPRDLLSPEALAANPPTPVPAGDLPKLPSAAQDTPALSDPSLIEKLRALGYMQ